MKNWRTLTLALIMSTSTVFASQEVDRVAAVVNNGVVLESDVNNLMRSVELSSRQNRQQLPDKAALRSQVIERLIMDNILLSMAKKMDVRISDADIDSAISNIAQQNRMTVDQMRKRLSAGGMNFNTYRAQMRKELTIAEVRNNEVRRRVTILPQEVDALAKHLSSQAGEGAEFNISHILLALPEKASQSQISSAQNAAIKLTDDLKKGADFGKMAITYSADAQALKGGEMGWGKLEEMPELFAENLSRAQKGSIVGPIRSRVGFHILRVNDIRGGKQGISVTEVHARHILLRSSIVMSDEQALAKLNDISQKLRNGADFGTLAKEYSEDPGSAAKGGDLGWSSPTAYDPAFRDALLKLTKGETSKPVHSAFGWHLIQLMDTRQVDKTDAAMKERAYRMLFNRKFSEEAQNWMQEERASAYVKITGSDAKQ